MQDLSKIETEYLQAHEGNNEGLTEDITKDQMAAYHANVAERVWRLYVEAKLTKYGLRPTKETEVTLDELDAIYEEARKYD